MCLAKVVYSISAPWGTAGSTSMSSPLLTVSVCNTSCKIRFSVYLGFYFVRRESWESFSSCKEKSLSHPENSIQSPALLENKPTFYSLHVHC